MVASRSAILSSQPSHTGVSLTNMIVSAPQNTHFAMGIYRGSPRDTTNAEEVARFSSSESGADLLYSHAWQSTIACSVKGRHSRLRVHFGRFVRYEAAPLEAQCINNHHNRRPLLQIAETHSHHTVAPGSATTHRFAIAYYRKLAHTHCADIEPLRMAVVSLFRPEQSGRLFVRRDRCFGTFGWDDARGATSGIAG
jgi:hypothetical protein